MTALLLSIGTGAQADDPALWQLRVLDGADYTAAAILQLHPDGRLSGRAPCNSFASMVTIEGIRFRIGPIRATRMACPDLREEQAFFSALAEMTTIQTDGDTLSLSNAKERYMVFTPAD